MTTEQIKKETTRIRIYGKELNRWTVEDENGRTKTVQIEMAYTDLDGYGFVVGSGSEDFSPERWNTAVNKKYVWSWDGKKRNKGGYRWFCFENYIKYRKEDTKAIKAYLKEKYDAAEIELR